MIKGIRHRIKLLHKDPKTDPINPFVDNGFQELEKNGFPFIDVGLAGQLGRISDQQAFLLEKIMLVGNQKVGHNKGGANNAGYIKDCPNKSDLSNSGLNQDYLNNAGRKQARKDVGKTEAQTTAVVESVNNNGRSPGESKDESSKSNNTCKIGKIEKQNEGLSAETCSAEDKIDLAPENLDKLSVKDITCGSDLSQSVVKIRSISSDASLAEASDKFRSFSDFSSGLKDNTSEKDYPVTSEILKHETKSIEVQSSTSSENNLKEATDKFTGNPETPKVLEHHKDQPRRTMSHRENRVINPRERKLSVPVCMGRERCQENSRLRKTSSPLPGETYRDMMERHAMDQQDRQRRNSFFVPPSTASNGNRNVLDRLNSNEEMRRRRMSSLSANADSRRSSIDSRYRSSRSVSMTSPEMSDLGNEREEKLRNDFFLNLPLLL